MSSQVHSITLTAKDGTQQTFAAIKRGAEQDARALQEMGRQGSAGLKQVDDAAKRTEKSTDDLNKRMAALGAVITGGAAILGEWSRSSQDADAIQRQLEASIAATGESYATYADRVEAAGEAAVRLGQDDEAASQAIAALTQITGSANVALDNMGLVMDLAAAKSMSLESAAELVGKVHEGNTGILQRYGIVVREGATAEEALAQIQAQVAGQAEAHATTYARLREELSNVTDAIGGAVGEFAPMLALLPGISSGLTLAGSAAGALAPNLTKAGVASKALSLAMGPAGIAVAAGAATFAIIKLLDAMGTSYVEAAEDAERATADLEETIARLGQAGSSRTTLGEAWKKSFEEAIAPLLVIQERLTEINNEREGIAMQPVADQAAVDARQKVLDALAEEEDRLKAVADQYGGTTEIVQEFAETQEALAKILTASGPGADEVLRVAQGFKDAYDSGRMSLAEYMNMIQFLAETMGVYDEAAIRAAGATDRFGESGQKAASKLDPLLEAIKDATDQLRTPLLDPGKEGAFGELARDLEAIGEATGQAGDIARARAVALGDELEAGTITVDRYTDAIAGIAEPFRELADMQERLAAGFRTSREEIDAFASRVADRIDQATISLQELAQAADDASFDVSDFGDQSDRVSRIQLELAANAAAAAGALDEEESALERMARGSTSAGVALRAFKDIQDGIIADQGQFTHQLGEYNQQLDLLQNAEDLLNQRREEGIALTAEQEDFLNRVDAAQARLEGGTEDATLALGMQALAYAENVKLGDQLNSTMGNVTGAVSELDATIRLLIATMLVLNDTDAEPSVAIAGLDFAVGGLASVAGLLDSIDGRNATASILINETHRVTREEIEKTLGGGGMVGAAQGRMVRVNEGGREMATLPTGDDVWLPTGTMVWPHAASTMGNRGKGAIPFTNYGNITIVANNPVEFGAHLRDYGLAGR